MYISVSFNVQLCITHTATPLYDPVHYRIHAVSTLGITRFAFARFLFLWNLLHTSIRRDCTCGVDPQAPYIILQCSQSSTCCSGLQSRHSGQLRRWRTSDPKQEEPTSFSHAAFESWIRGRSAAPASVLLFTQQQQLITLRSITSPPTHNNDDYQGF